MRLRRVQEEREEERYATSFNHQSADDLVSLPNSPRSTSSSSEDSGVGTRVNSPTREEISPEEEVALKKEEQRSFIFSPKPPDSQRTSPEELVKRKEINTLDFIKKRDRASFTEMKSFLAKEMKKDTYPKQNLQALLKEIESKKNAWIEEINALEKDIRTNAKPSSELEVSLKKIYLKEMTFSIEAQGEEQVMFTKSKATIYYTIRKDPKTGTIQLIRTEHLIMPKRSV